LLNISIKKPAPTRGGFFFYGKLWYPYYMHKQQTKKIKRIGVGGSAANPPHLGHLKLVEALCGSGKFDEIIWIPSGIRPDKNGFVGAEHRMNMVDLLLQKENKIIYGGPATFRIDTKDIYGENTPTIQWMEALRDEFPDAEVVWYTGADSVAPQERFRGKNEIEAYWHEGERLLRDFPFLIVPRPGYPDPSTLSLSSNCEIFPGGIKENISSTEIRQLIGEHDERFVKKVTEPVAEYIKKYHLYGW